MKELSGEALAILEAGRHGDNPTPHDRERLRGAVGRAVATGVAASAALIAAPVAAGAGTVTGTVVKVLVGVVLVGAAGTATVVGVHHRRETKVVSDTARAPLDSPQQAPLPAVTPGEPDAAVPASRSTPPSLGPLKRSAAAKHRNDVETLEAETADLSAIQDALRAGDPSRALTLLDRQARLYPDGKLRQERDAARIIALCDLHQTESAKAALLRFERAYPSSPLLDRVRAACAIPRER